MSAIAAAAVHALVSIALAGAVLAAGVALALRAAPFLHPRLRYLVAVAAVLASVALPPVIAGMRDAPAAALPAVPERTGTLHLAPGGDPGQSTSASVPALPVLADVRESIAAAVARVASGPAAPWIALVWLAGAAGLLAGECRAHLRLRARRRRWRPADAELRRRAGWASPVPLFVDAEDGPFAVGLLRRAVVLPAWLDGDEAAPAARHELDHVRWRDPLVHALLRALRAALWPCPHLWYLERVAHAEREAAADRAAAALPGCDRREAAASYAAVLLRVAARGTGLRPSFSAVHHAAGALEQRIVRLFRQPAGSTLPAGLSAALVIGAGVACAVAVVPPRRAAAASSTPPPATMAAARAEREAHAPGAAASTDGERPAAAGAQKRLDFANLPGAPLEIVSATAVELREGDAARIADPVVTLVNRRGETVSEFAVAFIRDGRVTAAISDTSNVAPGASYTLRLPLLPGETEAGTIHAPAADVLVTVLEARTSSGRAWGTHTRPGIMPAVPAALAGRVTRRAREGTR
ncbi:MAG TPA: M56 family metallopeptidase [Longimicrobium sp.]|nr:M56 family metallopeptidase [Longimicrobium sp.]